MNTKLRTKVKIDFEKYFFKLMNNSIFWKKYRKWKKTQTHKTSNNIEKK